MVYKLKTWRLPLAGRNARGKAIVNILPIPPGRLHRRDHAGRRARGRVGEPADRLRDLGRRRAAQRARRLHQRHAQRQDRDEAARGRPPGQRPHRLRGRRRDARPPALGRAIRFPTTDVRVFKGRDSTGVRGIRLAAGDEVVSMAIIRHFEATPEERAAYLKMRRAVAGATEEEEAEADDDEEVAGDGSFELGQARYAEMSAAEDLLLTITERGAGKLSSIARLSGARPRRPGRRGDGPGDARRPAGRARSRSRWTTRSCSPPTPASRSACRSTASPSARAAPAASGSSTPPPTSASSRWRSIAENGEEDEA